jgi:hypothetical protein
MNTTRKAISKWNKLHKGQKMEQVVYITTLDNGNKTSRTAHEQVKG